jgi:hypothetical protein
MSQVNIGKRTHIKNTLKYPARIFSRIVDQAKDFGSRFRGGNKGQKPTPSGVAKFASPSCATSDSKSIPPTINFPPPIDMETSEDTTYTATAASSFSSETVVGSRPSGSTTTINLDQAGKPPSHTAPTKYAVSAESTIGVAFKKPPADRPPLIIVTHPPDPDHKRMRYTPPTECAPSFGTTHKRAYKKSPLPSITATQPARETKTLQVFNSDSSSSTRHPSIFDGQHDTHRSGKSTNSVTESETSAFQLDLRTSVKQAATFTIPLETTLVREKLSLESATIANSTQDQNKWPIATDNMSSNEQILPTKRWSKFPKQKMLDALLNLMKLKAFVPHKTKPTLSAPISGCVSVKKKDIDRAQWEVLYAINKEVFKKLLVDSLSTPVRKRTVRFRGSTTGGYHFVVFMDAFVSKDKTDDYVIKVPGHGTRGRWGPEDEYMLTREAEALLHLSSSTNLPVPKVISYSATVDNEVGFPYIIMTRLPGQSADKIWFDQPYDPDTAYQHADFPTVGTEKKRVNFLRSLAEVMTQLQDVQFDSIGLPAPQHDVSPFPPLLLSSDKTYVWPYADAHKFEEREPSTSTQDYVRTGLVYHNVPQPDEDGMFTTAQLEILGAHKIIKMIFAHPVFHSDPGETFVLQHSDLDLQNILTDENGNITGIIDWDGSMAMPHCVGHAAVPNFLRRDWFPNSDALLRRPHMSFQLDHYREVYAAAMVHAGNPDAKYTTKSAIYLAALAAIYEGGSINDIVEKILGVVPCLRLDAGEFCEKLGANDNWKAAEQVLEKEVHKLLEPQLPSVTWEQVKEELKELELREWMVNFEGFLDPETKSD